MQTGQSADRILQAAIVSMTSGHHEPHCWRAHVPGEGYVNDGNDPTTRAEYLRQLERSATSEVENMGFAPAYAEPGYETVRGVLIANWNVLPSGLDTLLERAGYGVEWSDEWMTCGSCNRAIRTVEDSYCWEPAFKMTGDEVLCLDCAKENEEEEEEEEEAEEEEEEAPCAIAMGCLCAAHARGADASEPCNAVE